MAASTQAQLDSVNDAIEKVAGGAQRYRNAHGVECEYPALSELLKAKRELTALLAQETSGAVYTGISFGRPS